MAAAAVVVARLAQMVLELMVGTELTVILVALELAVLVTLAAVGQVVHKVQQEVTAPK